MSDNMHNLDEGSIDYFEFILGGYRYKMRYPTTEEVEDVAKEKDEDALINKMYSYISADDDIPPIEETLKKTNIKKAQRFIKMIKEEFASE